MKFLTAFLLLCTIAAAAQPSVELKKKDLKRDVQLLTSAGTIIVRLSDSTPLHRDNFLKLVKTHYFDSMLFHRVIKSFMIQAGDPNSKTAVEGQALGSGGPGYTVPAEFRETLFHKKGALAAARMGDNVNPERASSGSQFYIVQGRTFTDAELDSIEVARLFGKKISTQRRQYYRSIGGTPQLDGNYTVFGEVVQGLQVVDQIANAQTSRTDRPVADVRIISAKLVKRNKRLHADF